MSVKVIKNNRRRYKEMYALNKSPQRFGRCLRVFITTPRKPHSAKRKVAKIGLTTYYNKHAYIRCMGHNLRQFSRVLVSGGRTKDLPGMYYKIIVGKFDSRCIDGRRNARSKYGLRK
jgi:small subunit ribosomal protein S12